MTQTVRERLVETIYGRHKVLTRIVATQIVDAVLAELRTPVSGMIEAAEPLFIHDQPEHSLGIGFTAMIDHVRSGK